MVLSISQRAIGGGDVIQGVMMILCRLLKSHAPFSVPKVESIESVQYLYC